MLEPLQWLFLQHVPPQVLLAVLQELDPAGWWTWVGQERAVAATLNCVEARLHPLPAAYVTSWARTLGRACEEAAAAAEDASDFELHDAILTAITGVDLRPADAALEGEEEDDFAFKTYSLPRMDETDSSTANDAEPAAIVLPLRVGPQFRNVGMSLWTAAFALVEYLREELLLATDGASLFDRALPGNGLRVLELGAGVGMTGSFIEALVRRGRLPAKAAERLARVESMVVTDYQPAILENCLRSMRRVSEDGELRVARAAPLDWTEAEVNAKWLATEQFDIVLAADVTYDVEVNPDLARTIRQALETSRCPKAAKCVMFATHRNEQTFKVFADAVEAEGLVMNNVPVVAEPHPAVAHIADVAREAASQLKGMAASATLLGTFWTEMPELLQRHTITLKAASTTD